MDVVKTAELRTYLDELLRTNELPDSENALNGLQVENGGTVSKVGAGVDASERTILEAADRGVDLLIVHHGLFWDGNLALTGSRYRKVRHLLQSGMAVYSAHIPLDVHPKFGNNVLLAEAIGLSVRGWFGGYKGTDLGVWGDLRISREALAARLDEILEARIRLVPGGKEVVERVGVISGAAAGMMREAVDLGLDAFITGEGNHHTYAEALERGINLYYGGHYATEVWGVRALATHVAQKYGLPWEFISQPTGM